MNNIIKISFSAASHVGTVRTVNEDRIYANGKFTQRYDADYTQVSLETSGNQFIFAVSDGMETEMSDAASGISVISELRKFHQKARNSSKDIQVKLDEMAECVEQTNNLLYSISLGENTNRNWQTAFTGLIIENGGVAALNMGNCRVYKLDGDSLKLMFNDNKRAERLLKMGIINDEQAEMLTDQYKSIGSEGKMQVRKSDVYPLKEGTVYLLCSNGLTDAVNEDAIYEILASGRETDAIAGLLVDEALKNEGEDNITAVVIRVEQTGDVSAPAVTSRSIPVRSIPGRQSTGRINRFARNVRKRRLDVARLVSTLVIFVVIAAVIFGAFTLWLTIRKPTDSKSAIAPTGTQTPAVTATPTVGPTPQDVQGEDNAGSGDTGTAVDAGDPKDTGTDTAGDTGNTGTKTETTYKVKAGDSLLSISRKFYNGDPSKYKLIMEANKITDPDKIAVDQVLKIPALK